MPFWTIPSISYPVTHWLASLLIGLAFVLFMATLGHIVGMPGIFHSLFTNAQDRSWRLTGWIRR